MGFTNVAWESRSTEQLARDLTDGPGPTSVGQAGAAWVRVANELASVSADFDKIVERIKASFASQGSEAATRKLEEFGKWLQAISLSAAANGQRAEEAAVANTVAIMAMPSVSEAIEAKASQDMMASLAAYNGAILTGRFAEFDEAATADQANAAAVMQQYEEACNALAQPWDQPLPPDVAKGDALKAEQDAKAGEGSGGGAGGGGAGGAGVAPAVGSVPGQHHRFDRRGQAIAESRGHGRWWWQRHGRRLWPDGRCPRPRRQQPGTRILASRSHIGRWRRTRCGLVGHRRLVAARSATERCAVHRVQRQLGPQHVGVR